MMIPHALGINKVHKKTWVRSLPGVFLQFGILADQVEAQYNAGLVCAYAPYAEESGLDFKAALEVARQRDAEASLVLAEDFNPSTTSSVVNHNSVNR
jgi:hypothetical protein